MKTNLWRQFEGLLPSKRPLVGTVTFVGSDGSSIVDTLDGQTVKVRGTDVGVGIRVLVEDGRIVAQTPNLPSTTQFV